MVTGAQLKAEASANAGSSFVGLKNNVWVIFGERDSTSRSIDLTVAS